MELVAVLLTGAFALTFVAFSGGSKKDKQVKAQPIRVRAKYTREYELRRRGLIR
jgi:hypothetical protein